MLIFETENKFFAAEIRTINHPTSKFQATFITRKGIRPKKIFGKIWIFYRSMT